MTAIEFRNVAIRLGDEFVLEQIDLEIPAGTIWGVLGPNGAGKSTLLRAMATLVRPQVGSIRIGGHDVVVSPEKVRACVGYVPDTFGTYEGTMVAEYLDFFARCWGMSGVERRAVVADLLNLVDLFDRRDDDVASLSRGARQRLVLARALVHDPMHILLDDPFTSLDAQGTYELLEILRELAGLGKTIVLATNQSSEAQRVCDHVAILSAGVIVYAGETAHLLEQFAGNQHVSVETINDWLPARSVLEQRSDVGEIRGQIDGFTFLYRGPRSGLAEILQQIVSTGVVVSQFSANPVALPEVLLELQANANV